MTHFRPKPTDESPLANEVGEGVAVRGAGRAQMRAVKDPIESYGQEPRKPERTGDAMWFDGPCPFLVCLKTEGHSHPVCPECTAVRYGNPSCATCRREGPALREQEVGEAKQRLAGEEE